MSKASNYIPALRYGHKIMPQDIAGMLGLPYVGDVYYVDAVNGSDTANSGTSWNDAFATVGQAYSSTTNNNHDVIIVAPGGTSATSETSAITWSNNQTHLIGNTAPSGISPRARVIWSSDNIDPCMTISGQGCIFSNIQFATYQDSNDVLVKVTNNRNYFDSVHFAGMGSATAGDDATLRRTPPAGKNSAARPRRIYRAEQIRPARLTDRAVRTRDADCSEQTRAAVHRNVRDAPRRQRGR